MFDFVVRVVVSALALVAAVYLVPGVRFDGEPWQLLVLGALVGVVNAYLRPIVGLLSLPLNLIGLGFVGLLLNAGLLLGVAFVAGELELGFTLAGWPPGDLDVDVLVAALLTSIVVSVVSTALGLVRRFAPGI